MNLCDSQRMASASHRRFNSSGISPDVGLSHPARCSRELQLMICIGIPSSSTSGEVMQIAFPSAIRLATAPRYIFVWALGTSIAIIVSDGSCARAAATESPIRTEIQPPISETITQPNLQPSAPAMGLCTSDTLLVLAMPPSQTQQPPLGERTAWSAHHR